MLFLDETLGAKFEESEIPEDMTAKAQEYREKMIEALSDVNDALMEKYLGGETISEEEIKSALREGTIKLKITPCTCGTAFKNKGVQTAAGCGGGLSSFAPRRPAGSREDTRARRRRSCVKRTIASRSPRWPLR